MTDSAFRFASSGVILAVRRWPVDPLHRPVENRPGAKQLTGCRRGELGESDLARATVAERKELEGCPSMGSFTEVEDTTRMEPRLSLNREEPRAPGERRRGGAGRRPALHASSPKSEKRPGGGPPELTTRASIPLP
jgi:hypothetical protein